MYGAIVILYIKVTCYKNAILANLDIHKSHMLIATLTTHVIVIHKSAHAKYILCNSYSIKVTSIAILYTCKSIRHKSASKYYTYEYSICYKITSKCIL